LELILVHAYPRRFAINYSSISVQSVEDNEKASRFLEWKLTQRNGKEPKDT